MSNERISKIIFPILLSVLFLHFFGIPAVKKFLRKSTFFNKEKRENDFHFPAVTVCRHNDVESGWKKSKRQSYYDVLEDECYKPKTLDDLLKCINEKTYALEEIVNLNHSVAPMNASSWTTDITFAYYGKCHTFISDLSNEKGMRIFFKSKEETEEKEKDNAKIGDRIFIPSPSFFIINELPRNYSHN